MAESARNAVSRLSRAQDDLDAALRVFALTGAENESAAVERITTLRAARDAAQAEVDQIGPDLSVVAGVDDWSFDGMRAAIRAAVASAVVAPGGRGAERITVQLRGE